MPRPLPVEPHRILLIKSHSAGIGDILRSSAAWAVLKKHWPGAELHLVLLTRWLWLKNDGNLKVNQKEKLQKLLKDQNLKTAQAYQFRLTFQDIFTLKNRHQGATLLRPRWKTPRTTDYRQWSRSPTPS